MLSLLLLIFACGGEEAAENSLQAEKPQMLVPGEQGPDQKGPQQQGKKSGDGKTPRTFIYNSQSEDSRMLYKAEDGTCFVRVDTDKNPTTMGDTEAIDCPPQMASEAWANCTGGKLVKYNEGDEEGTCKCFPVGGDEKVVDCP